MIAGAELRSGHAAARQGVQHGTEQLAPGRGHLLTACARL